MYKFNFILCFGLASWLAGKSQVSASDRDRPDSVTVAASNRYTPASFLRTIFTGKNYRKEWETPVKMPVFDLKASGLKIVRLGGGQQTRSLRLVDGEGKEWALRTVDKFVEKAMPPGLKNTLAERVVQDMVSAAHPYGALVVSELSDALKLYAPQPVLYFVPDSEDFGEHRSLFANSVCLLEERAPGGHWDEVRDTEELLMQLQEQETLVLQKEILRARLLDMLIADWDRHSDQWGWGDIDSAGNQYYHIIPRDRDQAFFMSHGLIPKTAKLLGMSYLNGFKKKSRSLKKLSLKSWDFDRYFLNDLDAAEWSLVVRDVQQRLTDEVIDAAVMKLPPEVFAIGGKDLAMKLKSRRDDLYDKVMRYYRFIAAEVTIPGSNDEEIFRISGSGENLLVTIQTKDHKKLYERLFLPSETRKIVLYGLKGNDQFIVDESANTRIRLDIYGDKGSDSYDIKGQTRSVVFDTSSEKNLVINNGMARIKME